MWCKIIAVVGMVALSGCKKDPDSRSSTRSPIEDSSTDSETSGSTITGTLAVGDTEDADVISNAQLSIEGFPDVSGMSNEDGSFAIENAPTGSLIVYATKGESEAALTSGVATYGAQMREINVSPGEQTDVGEVTMKKTGGLKGIVSFFDNPNKLELIGSDVFVPGTSFIAKTDAKGQFVLNGLPEGVYSLRMQHTGFSPLDRENIEVLSEQITDIGIQPLSIAKGPEGKIAVEGGEIKEVNGSEAKILKARSVKATLTYDGDAALMKVSDEPAFLNKEWVSVATTASWEFKSDGPKSLYVKFSDLNGLESSPYSTDFYIDTEKPEIISVFILNDWIATASSDVYVDVNGSDTGSGLAAIMLSTSSNFSGASWQAYKSSGRYDFDLGAGATKTLYAKFKDYADRESGVLSDDIDIGSETIVKAATYDKPVLFGQAHEPYIIYAVTKFSKPVVIEPGVTIKLDASVHFTNTVQAKGTDLGAGAITLEGSTGCGVAWYNNDSDYGMGKDILYENVKFVRISSILMNGGTIKSSQFDNSACAFQSGTIYKTKFDSLLVDGNTFTDFDNMINVAKGTTTFSNNSGTAKTMVALDGGKVKLTDNTLTLSGTCSVSGSDGFIKANGGGEILDASGNTMNGLCDFVKMVGVEDVVIDGGFVVNGCMAIASMTPTFSPTNYGDITIRNITANDCQHGFYAQDAVPNDPHQVTFENNDLDVEDALVHYEENGSTWSGSDFNVDFVQNDIQCAHDSTASCDLFMWNGGTSVSTYGSQSLTLHSNNITCSVGFCSGFGAGGTALKTLDITIDLGTNGDSTSNYFIGRPLKTGITGTIYDGVVCSGPDEICISEYNDASVAPGSWTFPSNEVSGSAIAGTGPE